MKVAFTKMTGVGNDFIVIDSRQIPLKLSSDKIKALCDRHFGIGADGLIFVLPPKDRDKADFRMDYYNSDGGEAEMCGNGARCFARFVENFARKNEEKVSFETLPGLIEARFIGSEVEVELTAPHSLSLENSLQIPSGETLIVHHINTGVPHAITFTQNLKEIDLQRLGGEVRRHEAFAPNGTNVNFVQPLDEASVSIRTYERGVEAETLACGTGVTAAAIVSHCLLAMQSPIRVKVAGGEFLTVSFKKVGQSFKNVLLQGSAKVVFVGEVEI